MPVRIDVRDPGAGAAAGAPSAGATAAGTAAAAVDEVCAWLHEVDRRFSTYLAGSEISRINRGELAPAATHPDVAEVLARCELLRERTAGFFDARAVGGPGAPAAADRRDPSVHLPGAVDPSGLVKGWAVDRAGRILAGHGLRHWSINAGGDILLRGDALPEQRWRIGIQHPQRHDAIAAVVEGSDLAVATSGAYERGDHVLDPHTGLPPHGVLSVTIAGDELATADAYATTAFAMGLDGPDWTAALPGYEALTILADGRMLSTPGFPFAPGSEPPPARPRLQLRIERG